MLFRTLPFLFIFFSAFATITGQSTTVDGPLLFEHGRTFQSHAATVTNSDLAPFYHGVASGDPLDNRVIIWTRVTPDSLNNDPIDVAWQVATDAQLTNVVASGTFSTHAERDYTVKVDVTGLLSGTTYYYGFTALGAHSLTGRTKTTPAEADHLKFGVVSCSNFQAGYFNAYGRLAERNDLDAVIHLGDYIYEYGNFVYGSDAVWDERLLTPEDEIVSLFDYRARYGTYRLDTQLLRLHQQHPIIAIWDDHESANDSYEDGANNHDPASEGSWEDRKAASRQAYFEWMPIRDNPDQDVFRTLHYGELADLILLDTRLEGRDEQLTDVNDPLLYATDRTMLGAEQRAWFLEQLDSSQANWKIVAQQVIFSSLNVGWAGGGLGLSYDATESLFLDIWDGYPAERQAIIDHLADNELDNVVILTGDFHSSFAYDVAEPPVDITFMDVPGQDSVPFFNPSANYDPTTGDGSVAVEFATPSVTSANFDENVGVSLATVVQERINDTIVASGGLVLGNPNPHMKYNDLIRHGYFVLDVKADSVQADFFYTPILTEVDDQEFGGGFFTRDAENHLSAANGPSAPKDVQDEPAPLNPPPFTSATRRPVSAVQLLTSYPNPVTEVSNLQFSLLRSGSVNIVLLDAAGREVMQVYRGNNPAGLYSLRTPTGHLPGGIYIYRISLNGNVAALHRLIVD